jgi:hypothetical protein
MPSRCSPMRPSSNKSNTSILESVRETSETKVSFNDNITIHYYKKYIPKSRYWFWQRYKFSSQGNWFKVKTFFKNIFK